MAPFREGLEEGPTHVKPHEFGAISGSPRSQGSTLAADERTSVGRDESNIKAIQQLTRKNVETPNPVESCIHELIYGRCQTQPEAPAVRGWDGNFTFKQLDSFADSLAVTLSNKGVGPEVFVPICFEKSRWVVVAMLAVLKAGGAFVLLNPSDPVKRLKEICQKLKVEVVLTSLENEDTASQLGSELVFVDERITDEARGSAPASLVRPDNAAFAVFTSGTSGPPKCVLVEHRSYSTGALAHSAALNLTSSSRVLQFAPYSFNTCLVEILSVLIVGGCVCIPSETDRRSDLVGTVHRFEINWAVFTPSIARIIDVNDLPTLKTLVLWGESMSREDLLKWAPHVQLFNAYGTAECSIVAATRRCQVAVGSPTNIGYGAGASCWIVDENDSERLAPVDTVGEIVICGSIVSRGYVGDAQRTIEAFIAQPKWLCHTSPSRGGGRVYKTGDLAKYLEDGSIHFIGRRDAQPKDYGQRLELCHLEHHILQCFPGITGITVEVVTPSNSDSQLLAAFLAFGISSSSFDADDFPSHATEWLMTPTDEFRSQVQTAKADLGKKLQAHMVPNIFLPISYIPLTTGGKVHRRLLQQIVKSMTRLELQQYCEKMAAKRSPSNTIEKMIQQVWADVLQLPLASIGIEDDFWILGGNSIRAMKLAGAARQRGLDIGVADVWEFRTLEDMAATVMHRKRYSIEGIIEPFSLLQGSESRADLVQLVLQQCNIQEKDIEDIYPCTPLQEGLISLAAKLSSAYTICIEYELAMDVDLNKFRTSWEATIIANPILRTLIVQSGSGTMYQVVNRNSPPWDVRNPGQEVTKDWRQWKLGQRLVRFAYSEQVSATESSYFTLALHHAVSDGWALQRLLKQVEDAYHGASLAPKPFTPFIKYLLKAIEDADSFWENQFKGLNAVAFPKLPSPDYTVNPTAKMNRTIRVEHPGSDGITVPSMVKLAWALVISKYTQSYDVVFGTTVTGRGAPVLGIEEITGPTIASIPMRLLLNPDEPIRDILHRIQRHSNEIIPFEQVGLRRMSRIGPKAALACQFQSLLVIQPEQDILPAIFSRMMDISNQSAFSSYAINLICTLFPGYMEFDIVYDLHVVNETQLRGMLSQMRHIFKKIELYPSMSLRNLGLVNPDDLTESLPFIEYLPEQLERYAYEIIQNRCLEQPFEDVRADDDFLLQEENFGLAMKAVALAQDAGYAFTVADIFACRKLLKLARSATRTDDNLDRDIPPFSLMGNSTSCEEIIMELVEQGDVLPNQIEDIYPCSPYQEGLMNLTSKEVGNCPARFIYDLTEDTDIPRFCAAFDATVTANPILRTRITQTRNGIFQVVIRENIPWDLYRDQEDYNMRFHDPPMGINQRLIRLALISPTDNVGSYRFIVTIHNALYDSLSLSILWKQVDAAYRGEELPICQFNGFIDYLLRSNAVDQPSPIRSQELDTAVFPPLPSSNYIPTPDKSLVHTISNLSNGEVDHAILAKIHLAWAIILSYYTDSNDVTFGLIMSGRSAEVAGFEQVTGPTTVIVPLRLQLDPEQPTHAVLSKVQKEVVYMAHRQHAISHNIQGVSPASNCNFHCQLGIKLPMEVTGSRLVAHAKTEDLGYGAPANCALTVICHLGSTESKKTANAVASYDSHVLDPSVVQRMVEQFEHVLHCILINVDQPLNSIPTTSHQDMQRLVEWNSFLPPPYERCLHELVLDNCASHPDSPAVSAWDGNLSYSQLESGSYEITEVLVKQGVGNGCIVPVCFEKSKWCILAMFAVLRAGAAFVCIDFKHPKERIRQILEQVKPKAILTSLEAKDAFRDVKAAIITPSFEGQNSNLHIDKNSSCITLETRAEFYDPAFLIFTSGSTGRVKAIVIEHRHICSSIRDHSESMKVNGDTRALHFASYAFDISVLETFFVLSNGGCVCVPSESDRMNNLEKFIRDYQVNWAALTPSVANILCPENVPTVRTLVVGGEALTREVVETWASRVTLISGYGMAEVTICAAEHQIQGCDWKVGTLGKILGGVGWITMPSDPGRLSPIGAVGELIIEGPAVSRGYLHNPEISGFIKPPIWLARFRNGKPSRLYSTGDLVQYNDDGLIRFIGRKDFQVKVRGNRIELSDVEYHVRRCFDCQDAVAEALEVPGFGAPVLVTFVVLKPKTQYEAQSKPPNVAGIFSAPDMSFRLRAQAASKQLHNLVPAYMVPSVFFPLPSLPLTASGKANRKLLRKAVTELSAEDIKAYNTAPPKIPSPSTKTEEVIHAAWANVLQKDPRTFGVNDNFLRIGGDSINAMQVVSQCSRAGINFTVADIFKHKTVAGLSSSLEFSTAPDSSSAHTEETTDPFKLSPIQKLFFDNNPTNFNHFNQSLVLWLQKPVALQDLVNAIRCIIQNHSVLRMRFAKDANGNWSQSIGIDVDGSYRFHAHYDVSIEQAEIICSSTHKTLNIQDGPMFAIDLMILKNGDQYLSLIAHHLVIDTVSWQIIISDLEEILVSGRITARRSLPFQTWCQLQEEHIEVTLHSDKVPQDVVPVTWLGYWGVECERNLMADADETGFALDANATNSLLDATNNAFQTQPVELLHAALLYSFARTFRDRQVPIIFCEGHGRMPWDPSIDLTRTVGWFTDFRPLCVDADINHSLMDFVRRVKDAQRQSNEEERLASWYLLGDRTRRTPFQIEILFNYAGFLNQFETPGSLFKKVSFRKSELADIDKMAARFALVDVHAEVIDSRLTFQFLYNRKMRRSSAIIMWAEACKNTLLRLSTELASRQPSFTLSDLPLMRLTYDQLDDFLEQTVIPLANGGLEIVDVYPCSPIQRGMLLSLARSAWDYMNRLTLKIDLRYGNAVFDVQRFINAWHQVVARHPLLRTVFVSSPRGDGSMDQAVLKHYDPEVFVIPSDGGPLRTLAEYNPGPIPEILPPHRLTICRAGSGDTACLLEISHVIVDGMSHPIFIRDLLLAYDQKLDGQPDNVYHDYIAHIQQQETNAARTYWQVYLDKMQPCLFPSLSIGRAETRPYEVGRINSRYIHSSDLQSFCKANQITPATVFQVAWALVLRVYARTDDTCFGYLTSGRDLPITGMSDAVGPFINMLVCRILFTKDREISDVLEKRQTQFVDSLEFQHWSLADISHQQSLSHGKALFNSIMSVQKELPDMSLVDSSLLLRLEEGIGPTEYEVAVSIGILDDEINIDIEFHKSAFTSAQAGYIIDAFCKALSEIVHDPRRPANKITLLGGESEKQLWKWNQQIPSSVNRCVHEMILQQCVAQPEAPAVCAWDGSFSYSELDTESYALSIHLMSCGVKPETFVPIYCEKSRWVVIAVLAVIRAGGAFVLLDQSHPLRRLQKICKDCNAPVVLASEKNIVNAASLASKVIMLNDSEANWREIFSTQASTSLSPHHPLYMIYTSGSTGDPKGVVVPNRAFATSSTTTKSALGLNTKSRVFQLASYSFDACIVEILATMVQGGCICIPSETQKEQNLAQAAWELQVNWAVFTPSLARVLRPSDFPTLKTLIMVGETVTQREISTWSPAVELIMSYGPSECSVLSTTTAGHIASISDARNVGHTVGCRGWIVDENDHDVLLPLGAVGELLIEGSIVALGYLNDQRKTHDCFIDSPNWLRGRGGCHRLYKTGDLLRYTDDGALQFFARKDLQTKLRGQRLNLGGIEQHVRQILCDAACVVADVVTTVDNFQMLVAFVQLNEPPEISSIGGSTPNINMLATADDEFRSLARLAESQLRTELPDYMIPAVFLPLHYVPLTQNGKTDRQQLRTVISTMTVDEVYNYYCEQRTPKKPPSTSTEKAIHHIWTQVLNRDPQAIGVNDDFFKLGGDSISAIQIATECNAIGFRISVAEIFKQKTISEISLKLGVDASLGSRLEETTGTLFPLSPIQKLFFEFTPQGHNHFNWGFLFQLRYPQDSNVVMDAIECVIKRHSMLRARFIRDSKGGWHQTITNVVEGSYRFQEHYIKSLNDARPIFLSSQTGLNIEEGPLFAADHIHIDKDGDYLSLVGHRLVVDLASWEIIIGDIEELLRTGSISDAQPLSFQTWNTLQGDYSQTSLHLNMTSLDNGSQPPSQDDYWGMANHKNLHGDILEDGFVIDAGTTDVLFGAANNPFQTQPAEIFHAALLYSFLQTFRDRLAPVICIEDHGRTTWDSAIDISRTVGWFTSFLPIYVPGTSCDDLLHILRQVKDKRRLTSSDWSSRFINFATHFLRPNNHKVFHNRRHAEILFNYIGHCQQFENDDYMLKLVPRPSCSASDIANDIQRFSLIDVVAFVKYGCTHFCFYFNCYAAARRPIKSWILKFRDTLYGLADQLPSRQLAHTLVDFPLLPLSYPSLDKLTSETLPQLGITPSEIEDLYPCSPIQSGILLSQAKDPELYQTQVTWKVQAGDGLGPVEIDRLVDAWRNVVKRHSIFRTIFVKHICEDRYMNQIVLKTTTGQVHTVPSTEEDKLLSQLSQKRLPCSQYGEIPYHFTIGRTLTNDVFCALECSHALFDAFSIQLVLNEMQQEYDGTVPINSGSCYRDYISYLNTLSDVASKEYWRAYLDGIQPCLLPASPDYDRTNGETKQMKLINRVMRCPGDLHSFCERHGLTLSNLFQVAWGFVLKSYTGLDTVCFGYLRSSRDIPVPKIQETAGPLINMLVCRMDLPDTSSLESVLQKNHNDYIESLDYQHLPLADVLRITKLRGLSLFNTAISVLRSSSKQCHNSSIQFKPVDGRNVSEHDLVVHVSINSDSIEVNFAYWSPLLTETRVQNIGDSLQQAVYEIVAKADANVDAIQMLDLNWSNTLRRYHLEAPPYVRKTTHELIHSRIIAQPYAVAVCGWDGSFTYLELDDLSSRLATVLMQQGVSPGIYVSLYFERSCWMTIAMMGVIKAGGAFILLDPSYPIERLQDIYMISQSSMIIASESKAPLASNIGSAVIVLGKNEKPWATNQPPFCADTITVSPRSALYAVLTSDQKSCVIIDHQAFSTSATVHSIALQLDKTSRVLQFARYASDICIWEILAPLVCGGCVCIPSDFDLMQNLPLTVARLRANWAILSASRVKALHPADFPTIKTLVVEGGISAEEDFRKWQDRDLYVAYGSIQCAGFCTATKVFSNVNSGRRIGSGLGCRTYVVDANNHERLAPVGAVGELLIEGPIVGLGYLNDVEKTAMTFINPPSWLERISSRGFFPVYKTGDLVQFSDDGTLYYIGQKNAQVQVRGRHAELDEIEHHIQNLFRRSTRAIVESVTIQTMGTRQVLVAFIYNDPPCINGCDGSIKQTNRPLFAEISAAFCAQVENIQSRLSQKLQTYMVPELFLPLAHIPLSANGEVDRERLRQEARSLSEYQIREYGNLPGSESQPSTEDERKLQDIWAKALNLAPESIGVEDDFFRLGGDSLSAMHVAAQSAANGMSVTVSDIFQYKTISRLAQSTQGPGPVAARETNGTTYAEFEIAPFSLIDSRLSSETLLHKSADLCQVQVDHIDDIYPCTPLQEGLMALAAKHPSHFVAKFECDLATNIDIQRLRYAWDVTAAANPVLRTRIVQIDGSGIFQVVVRGLSPCREFPDLASYAEHCNNTTMDLGKPLVDLSIIHSEDCNKSCKLYGILHHAIYDGWSLPLLFRHVQAVYYNNTPINPQPFNHFIKYILNMDGADEFWKSEFQDLNATPFPPLPSSKYVPSPTSSLSHAISHIELRDSEYTMTTVIQLAWSVIMSSYTDSEDVVFGLTVSGRNAPIPRINEMTGPTFATVPLRVKVEPHSTVSASLSYVQNKTTAMIPFQHIGLQNIRLLSPQAAEACNFQCHLGIQPQSTLRSDDLFKFVESESQDNGEFASYAFVMVCHLDGSGNDSILVTVSYDEKVLHSTDAKRLLQQFEQVLRQISQNNDMPLYKLNLLSLDDQLQLYKWNHHLPCSYEVCLHDLILTHSARDPTASAIAAWDGVVTYEELDKLSLQLAKQLRTLGLQKGSTVPLCFNKSKWAIVTMTAVLRAGGTCVPLDPASPREHIQNAIRRTAARLVLTSPENEHAAVSADVLSVTIPLLHERPLPLNWDTPHPKPQDSAFVVFTNESTGKIKGNKIQHSSMCTSIREHSSSLNIGRKTRSLHFTSYSSDISLYEIFSVLVNGGCVCVPSEHDHINNLPDFIRDYEINLAIFSSSMLNMLRPEDCPPLKTVIFRDETIMPEVIHRWTSANVTLINGYGSAETTICAVREIPSEGTIGPLIGSVGWITNPSDPSRLAPIGAVGELLIEGPVVTQGYLDDPEATAAAYIPAPRWLADFRHGTDGSILYRTGDLVRYTENGGFKWVGRKDTQITVRGHRVDLESVEKHVRQCFPSASEIIADVTVNAEGSRLVAFIYEGNESNGFISNGEQDLFFSPNEKFLSQIRAAKAKLSSVVPPYMVPASFLRLSRVPRIASGAINRRQLRERACLDFLDRDSISSTAGATEQRAKSGQEQLLCNLWAGILKMQPERINVDDDFFTLGGDSIRAMKLASMARQKGLNLTVSSIFDNRVLSSMAKHVEKAQCNGESDEYHPGSLIGVDLKSFLPSLARECGSLNTKDVVDILPTTEFQQLFLKQKNVTYICLELAMHIDPDRLEAACNAVVRQHHVLRTVFVPSKGEYLQVILRDIEFRMVRLDCENSLERFTEFVCQRDFSSPVPFGTPHFQPYLLSRSESHHMFVMRISHAQYDGASLPLILTDLSIAYNENLPESMTPQFAIYLRYRLAQRSKHAYQFWQDYLNASQMTDVRTASLSNSTCCKDGHLVQSLREIPLPSPPEGITIASLAKAAWAVVLARLMGQRDIVFGHVINGRDAPIADVTSISGPCVTVSPIRVTIQPSWSASDLLHHVQSQYRRAMPFANLDFKDILKNTATWPVGTEFGSILTHQDADTPLTFPFGGVECSWKSLDFGIPTHFHVATRPLNGMLAVIIGASCRKVSEEAAGNLIDQLCQAITDLSNGSLNLSVN